jgi:hypothetical protein
MNHYKIILGKTVLVPNTSLSIDIVTSAGQEISARRK